MQPVGACERRRRGEELALHVDEGQARGETREARLGVPWAPKAGRCGA
ncbi:MAG: hypothetical protein MZW92_08875 [Comamonadaceae bacterium]|nr:hypothetical protein [Comamonadaceae bacterium]